MISSGVTTAMRREVYRRDGYRCALCDSTRYLQIHHYHPRGKGGADHPMNLVTLCNQCHMAVHGTINYPDMSADDISQAIAEYLGDYYAPDWYAYDG